MNIKEKKYSLYSYSTEIPRRFHKYSYDRKRRLIKIETEDGMGLELFSFSGKTTATITRTFTFDGKVETEEGNTVRRNENGD